MDPKCLEIIALTWDLVQKEHKLLSLVIPTAQDIAQCLIAGQKPTPEQVDAWDAINSQVTHRMIELTANFESVRKAVTPVLRFDA
jgi:hypothetical protein